MLILLPPSEGKATPGRGRPLDLAKLSFPGLTETRERVIDALITLSKGPESNARAILGLSPGQREAIDLNRVLLESATLPVARLYTGVLYDHLGLATLPKSPGRYSESLRTFSGLWGALKITDRIPPYRLSMGVRLPPLGALASVWRPVLTAELRGRGLIVDLRSATYTAAWRPPAVAVRVLRERDGRRTVVSHMAKATRGAIARSLLVADANPRTPAALVSALRDLGHTVELAGSTLDVIIRD